MDFGLGNQTLGGFPDSASGSTPDPLPGLLADPTAARTFLLRAQPLDDAGDPVDVDYSTDGYMSWPSDTPYKLFPSAIGVPYNFQASLPLPDLMGGSSLGIGDLTVNNPDALRDADADYDWLGVPADVYIGRPTGSLGSFTRIFRGISAGVTKGIDTWSILHRDLRFKLQKRLQTHRYKGFGAALRFDGAASVASGAVTIPAGTITIEGMFCRITSPASQAAAVDNNSVGAAGSRRILPQTDGTIIFRARNDAAGAFASPATPVLTAYRWYHLAWVLNTATALLHTYVDGIEQGTPTALTGTWATSIATTFYLGRDVANTIFWNGQMDELRIWTVARTEAEIMRDKDRVLLGTETGLVHYYHMDEGSGGTLTDSVSGGVNLTATSCIWVGSLEGDASIAGKVKPCALGKRRSVRPVLVDPQNLVYQVNDGSINAILAVKIAGDPLTFGANRTDPYDGTPTTNKYDTCLARGYIKLGTSPGSAEVTVDLEGDAGGSLGYQSTAAGIHRKLAVQFGGLSDPGDIDTVAYARLAALQPAVTGRYYDSEVNIDAAMDDVMRGICAWWSPTRVAKVTVGRVEDPSPLTASVSIAEEDILDPSAGGIYEDAPVNVRIGEVIVGYRPYHTTLDPNQSAGALDMTTRYDLGQEYRYVFAPDPNRTADADTLMVYTDFDDKVAAQAEADRLLALWKVTRHSLKLRLDSGVLSYFLGSVLHVTCARYNLAAGKNAVCIAVAEDMGSSGAADSLEVTLFY